MQRGCAQVPTLLVLDKAGSIQICGRERPQQRSARSPAVERDMLHGEGHIGPGRHAQLPIVACGTARLTCKAHETYGS